MILTNEERLEQEVAEKRKYIEEYANEKAELRQRLAHLATLIDMPLMDEELDVQAFGRDQWVYCRQHVKPHETGWCSVGVYDKIGLGVQTADEAYAKCEAWGLPIFDYNKKD